MATPPPPRARRRSKAVSPGRAPAHLAGELRFRSFEQVQQLLGATLLPSGEPATFIALAVSELGFVRSTFGYTVGERVLDLCAERLVSETREGDFVIPLRGDIFAIILHGQGEERTARSVADRLMERLERSFLADGHLIDLQASAGIALSKTGEESFDTLLSKASLALRTARSAGASARTACLFEPGMDQGVLLEQALIQDLRRALPLRQFSLVYQPQVCLSERRVNGVEALLRWHHPVRGPISPALFIPLAEATGAIHQLGAWVLRTACKQAALLPSEVKVAVNVSPLQLRNPEFAREVGEALLTAAIPPSRLEIEMTEGILLDGTDTTLRTVKSLRDMGVQFAIDDFGTGYSSLSQIGRLPFTLVKIDRSLVGLDPKRRAVVRAVVALAQGLGMDVLAEGVENQQDIAALQADGCFQYQGYWFSKPVGATEISARLHAVAGMKELTLPTPVRPSAPVRRHADAVALPLPIPKSGSGGVQL